MGTCARFFTNQILHELCTTYNIEYMVETGTGTGDSIQWASQIPYFKEIYSVEIHTPTYNLVIEKFADNPRIQIRNQKSLPFLEDVCKLDGNILFFLDAHFPGSYFSGINISENTADLNWPLELEIPLIQRLRSGRKDCILIDDLRVYEDGPYGSGPCPDEFRRIVPMESIGASLLQTHKLNKFYNDEGYALFTPK